MKHNLTVSSFDWRPATLGCPFSFAVVADASFTWFALSRHHPSGVWRDYPSGQPLDFEVAYWTDPGNLVPHSDASLDTSADTEKA